MIVDPAGPLVGRSVEEAGLRQLTDMYLAEIDRQGRLVAAVSPDERLQGDDRLIFVGVIDSAVDLPPYARPAARHPAGVQATMEQEPSEA